jgi:hypothetical protein
MPSVLNFDGLAQTPTPRLQELVNIDLPLSEQ